MVTSWLRVRFPPSLSSSKAKEREKNCGSFVGSDLSCLQNWDWNCSTHLHRSSLLLLYMVWENCGELHGEHHTYTSASGFLSAAAAAAAKEKDPPPVQQQHSIFFAGGQASGWSDIEKIKTSHYKSQKNVHSAKLGGDFPKKRKEENNAVLQNEWPKTEQFSSLSKCARAQTHPSPWA